MRASRNVLVLVLASAASLNSTTCVRLPLCQRVWPGSVLFIASVTKIEELAKRDAGLMDRTKRIHMKVKEIFEGLPAGSTEAIVEAGDGIEPGQTYLIDAYREADVLVPRLCGSTRPVDFDAEFLQYLRERKKGVGATSLAVRVYAWAGAFAAALPDARVTISGPKGDLEAGTDMEGTAIFSDVIPGFYSIAASKPFFTLDRVHVQANRVEVLSQTCLSVDAYLLSDLSVSGTLRAPQGGKAANIELDLVAIEPEQPEAYLLYSYEATTDQEGKFRFDGVNPGHYLLGPNIRHPGVATTDAPRTYYPGYASREEATEIPVVSGRSVDNIEFTLVDVGPRRSIRVHVVDEAGRPVANANLHESDGPTRDIARFGSISPAREHLETGVDGSISLEGFERASYFVRADAGGLEDYRYSNTVEVPPGKGPTVVILVVKPPDVKPARRVDWLD